MLKRSACLCLFFLASLCAAEARTVSLTSVYGSKEQAFLLSTLNLKTMVRAVVSKTGRKPDMGYAAVDLNNDGIKEYIVAIFDEAFCNQKGCEHDIYQKLSGRWQKIGTFYTHSLSTGTNSTRGYLDLQTSNGQTLSWAGSAYRQSGA